MKQEHVDEIEAVEGPREVPRAAGSRVRAGRKPAKVFRHGACSACIFFNPVERSGESVELPSVSFAKLYTKRGLLRSTSSLHPEDLPAAIVVIGQAYEWLKQLEEEEQVVMPHA